MIVFFYECECGGHGIRYKREYVCGETLSVTRINAHLFSFSFGFVLVAPPCSVQSVTDLHRAQ